MKILKNLIKIQEEEKKPSNNNNNIGDDLAKSIFKAQNASTNFRKQQTNHYRAEFKKDHSRTKIFENVRFPVEEPNPINEVANEEAYNLAKSFIANKGKKDALAISSINKIKIAENKTGFLLKKNRYFFQKSTRRYCKIKNRKFIYYAVGNKESCLGCIDFDSVTMTLHEV